MRTTHTIVIALCVIASFAVGALSDASRAQSPKPQPGAKAEAEWATWLVRVNFVHRQNPEVDSDELKQLQAQLEGATKPADKRKIQRQIDDAKKQADQRRGYVIYGWSVHADATGKPVDATRALAGFFLAGSAENTKVVAALKPDVVVAMNREGSKDLFTVGGRRWISVLRAAIVKNAVDIGDAPSFKLPPDKPMTDGQRRSLETSLNFSGSKPAGSGGESHRFTYKVSAEAAPPDAGGLQVWMAMNVAVDGEMLGPVIEHIEVPRGKSGGFTISESFDLITRPGVKVDGQATVAEPIAMLWGDQP